MSRLARDFLPRLRLLAAGLMVCWWCGDSAARSLCEPCYLHLLHSRLPAPDSSTIPPVVTSGTTSTGVDDNDRDTAA